MRRGVGRGHGGGAGSRRARFREVVENLGLRARRRLASRRGRDDPASARSGQDDLDRNRQTARAVRARVGPGGRSVPLVRRRGAPHLRAHRRIACGRRPVRGDAGAGRHRRRLHRLELSAALVARKVAPALAAGCSILVRPSSQTPGVAMVMVDCVRAGDLSAGAVSLVVGATSDTYEPIMARKRFAKSR